MNSADFRIELQNRLHQNADRVLIRVIVNPDAPPVELTGIDILHKSIALASEYSSSPPQTVVLLLLPHSVELFLLQIGLVLTGRVPAILAWPTTRIDPEKYQRNLLHQLQNLPAQEIITLPKLAANLHASLPYAAKGCAISSAIRWEEAFARFTIEALPMEKRPPRPEDELNDALFLQFSGGTTGAQKAVVITGGILSAQLERLRTALEFTPEDSVVSWLPMYHDMGLIACLWQPLWSGAPSTQLAAGDWLMNPALLFELIERYHGTFTWLPNFAFSYLASQSERIRGTYHLQGMRAWINCSEPVRISSMRDFADRFAKWGVDLRTLHASYAMAENVFAVTQTQLDRPPRTCARASLARACQSMSLAYDLKDDRYVSSGKLIDGMKIRILRDGTDCGPHEPGEIYLQTDSLFSGYWGTNGYVRTSFNSDGWYATGDYGFMVDDELFVIGRLKDIIIIGGQNVFPEDVETVVNDSAPLLYPGRVVAFGITDSETATECLIVVAEMRGEFDPDKAHLLEREIYKIVLSALSIAPRHVMVVPERWIVKSTAGKISRTETRQRYLLNQNHRTTPDCVVA